MGSLTAHDIIHKNGETTHYYEGGSKDGIPLIFVHGWPDIAESWKHQLSHFTAQPKYRVIAPDMRGYGGSSAPADKRAYSLKVLVGEMVELAGKLGVKKAIWVGHDWGCGVVSSLAAHHPELFLGLVNMSVPYRTLELGLDHLKQKVNRDIYPEAKYEWGQFSYMRYYQLHADENIEAFEKHAEKIIKALHLPHDPSTWGKPALTSRVLEDGGWFGGKPGELPDVPLEKTILDQSLFENLLKSHRKHGFFPPTAYYLNDDANVEFAKSEKNGGLLEFPVLFIDAKYDAICSPSTAPKMVEGLKAATPNSTWVSIDSEHWVQLEKPAETNNAMDVWLAKNF